MGCIENFHKIEDFECSTEDHWGIVFYDDYDFQCENPLRFEWYDTLAERDRMYHEYCMDI